MNALADGRDEGRGKLRKVPGSCTRTLIRECPNGETLSGESLAIPETEFIGLGRRTWGSEPSQYPQEKKTIVIPEVAASEPGPAQTSYV